MRNKTIVVTGGSGYIGTEVVLQLIGKGYKVINIDKKNPLYKNKNFKFYKYNLLKPLKIIKGFNNPIACIHLAAEVGGVEFANKFPATILRNNSIIDINTLDFCFRLSIKKFIYISSSLVYQKSKKFPLRENDTETIAPPSLSYGIGKLFGERLCSSFAAEKGNNFSICRLFNAYGLNSLLQSDPNGHVIPDLINKIKSGQYPVEVRGGGKIKRNFTHVRDLASGIIAVLENERSKNQIFNIASSQEYSLQNVVSIIWKISKKDKVLKIKKTKSFKIDVERNFANAEKAKKLLGWKTLIKIEDGLKEIMSI